MEIFGVHGEFWGIYVIRFHHLALLFRLQCSLVHAGHANVFFNLNSRSFNDDSFSPLDDLIC